MRIATMYDRGCMMKRKSVYAMVAGILGLGSSFAASAQTDVYLCAGAATKTLPPMELAATAPEAVTIWGYKVDDNGDLNDGCGGTADYTSPGPRMTLPDGETKLIVHLRNDLTVPTSIMIKGEFMPEDGQGNKLAPVYFSDGGIPNLNRPPRERVRSLTQETAPNGGQRDYVFDNLKPGTYAYQSASHMAVQQQMGLFGAMTVNFGANEAYAGQTYDKEVMLFYSEIDPALHAAIVGGNYGPGKAVTSTINYHAQYYLVNGEPFDPANPSPALPAGDSSQKTLVRIINMGQEEHVPTFNNARISVIAEDGRAYGHPRDQYSVVLEAAMTKDALFQPSRGGVYAVYDSVLNMSNGRRPNGGMLSYIQVAQGANQPTGGTGGTTGGGTGGTTTNAPNAAADPQPTANQAPIAVNDRVTIPANDSTVINVLANDSDDGAAILPETVVVRLVTGQSTAAQSIQTKRGGTATVLPDNSIKYDAPQNGFLGTDVFKYTVTDNYGSGLTSNQAKVRVNLK